MTTTAAERLQALRQCEWAALPEGYRNFGMCPVCDAEELKDDKTHREGCLLARMIAEAEQESVELARRALAGDG